MILILQIDMDEVRKSPYTSEQVYGQKDVKKSKGGAFSH